MFRALKLLVPIAVAPVLLAGCPGQQQQRQADPVLDHQLRIDLPAGWCVPQANGVFTSFVPDITPLAQRPVDRMTLRMCFSCNDVGAANVTPIMLRAVVTPGQQHILTAPTFPAQAPATNAAGCTTFTFSLANAVSATAQNDTITAEAHDTAFVGRYRTEPLR